MQRRLKATLFFTLGLSFLFTPILSAQNKQPPVQRWEYKTVNLCAGNRENTLYDLGDEGWEHISESNCNALFRRLKSANAPKYVAPQASAPPKEDAPTCNWPLAQAPTIRGLRLGMTLEELSELFPGASLHELKLRVEQAAGYWSFGQLGYGFRGEQHKERPENVGFYVNLFDGRVRSYKVEYSFSNSTNYGRVFSNEQLIDKLNASLKLPPKENWRSEYPGRMSIKCVGFKIEVDAQSTISISVEDTDPNYLEKIKQRRLQDAAKKQIEFKP